MVSIQTTINGWVELLIRHGADVDSTDDVSAPSSLMPHISPSCCNILATLGYLPNYVLWAVWPFALYILLFILRATHLIHILQDGYTPLHRVTWFNRMEIAELLIGHGANVNIKNNVGTSSIFKCDTSMALYYNDYFINLRFYDKPMVWYMACVLFFLLERSEIVINLIHVL